MGPGPGFCCNNAMSCWLITIALWQKMPGNSEVLFGRVLCVCCMERNVPNAIVDKWAANPCHFICVRIRFFILTDPDLKIWRQNKKNNSIFFTSICHLLCTRTVWSSRFWISINDMFWIRVRKETLDPTGSATYSYLSSAVDPYSFTGDMGLHQRL